MAANDVSGDQQRLDAQMSVRIGLGSVRQTLGELERLIQFAARRGGPLGRVEAEHNAARLRERAQELEFAAAALEASVR